MAISHDRLREVTEAGYAALQAIIQVRKFALSLELDAQTRTNTHRDASRILEYIGLFDLTGPATILAREQASCTPTRVREREGNRRRQQTYRLRRALALSELDRGHEAEQGKLD